MYKYSDIDIYMCTYIPVYLSIYSKDQSSRRILHQMHAFMHTVRYTCFILKHTAHVRM